MKMVDLNGQYERLKAEIDEAVEKVLASGAYIKGTEVTEFQENLSRFLSIPHVIGCGSGTDALQIALMALGLQPGDEVITTPFTFIATAEVMALLRVQPVFVDVEEKTFNLDIHQINAAITPRTKAILPVHLYGQSANMDPLLQIAEKHGLYVVEDACQSIGAEYIFADGQRKMTGTMGTFGCTSFFPTKNLGCYGDGGAMFTHDAELAKLAACIANHGAEKKYHHERVGVNSRLDTLQAAILNVKLRHLGEFTQARQSAADRYDTLFADCDWLTVPYRASYSTHVFHQYTVRLADRVNRDQLQELLRAEGVPTMVYYPVPLHLQPVFAELGYRRGDFPVAEHLADTVLSLPMHTELTAQEQEKVREVMGRVVEKCWK